LQPANPGVDALGRDHTTEKNSIEGAAPSALFAGEGWLDPIGSGILGRIRELIEELVEQKLGSARGRGRYERGGTSGHRHGHRTRLLTGSFGSVEFAMPRARPREPEGTKREWRSAVVPRYTQLSRRWPTAWRRQARHYSPSPGCI